MPSTRASTLEETAPTCHVLNYFTDQEDGFAMTALVHTLRFHIMLDPDRFENEEVRERYLRLVRAVHASKDEDGAEAENPTNRKRKRDETDSGYGSSPAGGGDETPEGKSVTLAEDDREDNAAVRKLQNWVLGPFGAVFADKAPASEERRAKTVREWFHGPVRYYTLTCDADGRFSPLLEEGLPTKPLEKRVADLIPGLRLPKYITSAALPVHSTSDLTILETSDSPSPRHPCLVRSSSGAAAAAGDGSEETRFFLKLVDPSQPAAVKRELKTLLSVADKGLVDDAARSSSFRAPLVRGLVVDSTSSPRPEHATSSPERPLEILGFLLTPIPDATPLTEYLDTDAAEGHRARWAGEVERVVRLLHENGIVWGDAKADNFVVDRDNRLWIIDFGGSYTEGWVDEEKRETMEGDDQGVEKVVNALRDPENFTFDPEEEKADDDDKNDQKQRGQAKKRKIDE